MKNFFISFLLFTPFSVFCGGGMEFTPQVQKYQELAQRLAATRAAVAEIEKELATEQAGLSADQEQLRKTSEEAKNCEDETKEARYQLQGFRIAYYRERTQRR